MNDLFSQIGIVVWGCKGGCRTFCDNKVVDVIAPDIRQTLKDIRSFITISKPAIDFYALEFTARYKVFTQYRSSNDLGNGAFIAVTIFVPHKVRIQGMRIVLNEMMNDYFMEYMNPLNYSPLSGKYDDINKYISILRNHESDVVTDNSHHYHTASKQDDHPQIIVYKDITVVDDYFKTPYRPEFFNCQEVMFLNSDIYENQSKYEVKFLYPPVVIANISEPIPESVIHPFAGTPSYQITRFLVNGEDFTGATTKVPLSDEDTIDLTISQKHYEPKSWNGVNVSQLIEAGIVKRRGRDFEFVPHFALNPQQYIIRFVNNDTHIETRDLLNHLLISDGFNRYPLTRLDRGEYGVIFEGNQVEKTNSLEFYIQEFKDPSTRDISSLVKLRDFNPYELIQAGSPVIELHVHEMELRLKAPDQEPARVNVVITSPSLKTPIKVHIPKFKEKIILPLPTDGLLSPSLDVSADNFDSTYEDDRFILTPKFKVVTLKLPRNLRDAFGNQNVKISYKSQDGTVYPGNRNNDKYEFTLPYKWKQDLGNLVIQGRTFKITAEDDKILFSASIVVNKTSKTVTVNCILRDNNDTTNFPYQTIERSSFLIFPEGTAFELPDDSQLEFKTREVGNENGIYRVDIEQRESRVIGPPTVVSGPVGIDIDSPAIEYKVTLCNCDDLYVHGRSNGVPTEKRVSELPRKTITVTQSPFKIYNKKEKEICTVFFPRSAYSQEQTQEAENRKNGFDVEWISENECTITYKPQNIFSRLKGAIDKKILLGLFALLIVCLLSGMAYFFISHTQSPAQFVFAFSTIDGSAIDRIETELNSSYVKNEGDKLIIERKEGIEKEFKFFFDKSITFIIEGSKKVVPVMDLGLSNKDRQNLGAFIDGKLDNGRIDVDIYSPGEDELRRLQTSKSLGTCTIEECAKAANDFKRYKEEFNRIACELAKDDNYAKLEESKEFFQPEGVFAGTEMTDALLSDYEEYSEKYAAEEAAKKKAEAEQKALQAEYDKLEKALGELTCTSATVDEFEKFIKANDKFNTQEAKKRVAQYRMVFNYPDNGKISSKLNSKCFSKKQWKLLEKIVKSGIWDDKHFKKTSILSNNKKWDNTRISFIELDDLLKAVGGTY